MSNLELLLLVYETQYMAISMLRQGVGKTIKKVINP